ncbi:hypothetical protein R5R35_004248 [Gryllus longicercus]|uniref:Eukaryotic translation initiation factor 4E binding protein n=1 Tax=Gryllus longicercus TaxID=2509291 RepID=A0AAN9VWK4_9ORTH
MSASPVARQATQSQVIPSRKVLLSDPAQLPADYASTPGGTLYSTTPGGTRIVYERAFLLQLRHSPLARTPPKNIPSALIRGASDDSAKENIDVIPSPTKTVLVEEDENQDQFQLEM